MSKQLVKQPPKGQFEIRLESANELIRRIETDVTKVETPDLVSFYVAADQIKKKIEKLSKDKARKEIIRRRNEGTPSGDNSQHREFEYGDFLLTVQEKQSMPVNADRLKDTLLAKKLWGDAVDVSVSFSGCDVKEVRVFLKWIAAHLKKLGAVVNESINEKKVASLVELGRLTELEFKACLDEKDPEYALIPKLKKEE